MSRNEEGNMAAKVLIPIFCGLLLVSGCVSSKTHQQALTSMNAMKTDLEGRLVEAGAQRVSLEAEISRLNIEAEALQKENNNLRALMEMKENKLAKNVQELQEKLAQNELRIKALNDEIIGLKKEKDAVLAEKALVLQEKEKTVSNLQKTYDGLVSELKGEIAKGEIAVTQLKDKLTLSMVEKILFESGSAEVRENGKAVLDRVSEILKTVSDKQIRIEGHTDNVPISYRIIKQFPSNWELSTARATNVVKYLCEKGLDPKVLSAAGYGENRPVDSNDTDEGKAKNRRIEVVLLPLDTDRVVPVASR